MKSVLAVIFQVLSLAWTPLAAQESGPENPQTQMHPDTGLDPRVQTSKISFQNYFNKQPLSPSEAQPPGSPRLEAESYPPE